MNPPCSGREREGGGGGEEGKGGRRGGGRRGREEGEGGRERERWSQLSDMYIRIIIGKLYNNFIAMYKYNRYIITPQRVQGGPHLVITI